MPGIQIIGAGNSVTAKVNNLGRLQVESTIMNMPHNINLNHELAYVASFSVSPSADSYFCYMRNESEDEMIIESTTICTLCAADDYNEIVSIYANPEGNPSGGDDMDPINSNFGSNKVASGIFQYGSEIGGLSNGTFYGSSYFKANTITKYTFENWIVMPRNTSLVLHATYGAGSSDNELTLTMPFFYITGL